MKEPLNEAVLQHKKQVLGICVGMQLLAASSEEGTLKGLNWIDAEVKRFDEVLFSDATHLPHMGWNSVALSGNPSLFAAIDAMRGFYFLHSYFFDATDPETVAARVEYGGSLPCAVERANVFGVQFHPEKSHTNGGQLFANFADLA